MNRHRRTRCAVALMLSAFPVLGMGSAASAAPYAGFTSDASATPVKIEVVEPAIPIPVELNLSYTQVSGRSGPTATALASVLWPGALLGEGLPTLGDALGLPPQLTAGGYPVQSSVSYPGDHSSASQEPLPGEVQRVSATGDTAVAKAGFSTSGDVSDGSGGDEGTSNPLGQLKDPTALLGALTGSTGSSSATSSPLGELGLLLNLQGVSSLSSTTYDGDSVTASAVSKVADVNLLLGLVRLDGLSVTTKVTSSLDGGAVTSRTVDVAGLTIAGKHFAYGPDGFTAAGSSTPAPGLPRSLTAFLARVGITIEMPQPVASKDGLAGSVSAEALRITLDTGPLRRMLPSLPLDGVINALPDLPGELAIVKGLLASLNTIAPKIILHLGQAAVSANTVAPLPAGSDDGSPVTPVVGGAVAPPISSFPVTSVPAAVAPGSPQVAPQVTPQAADLPGLPPLATMPGLAFLCGLLAAGAVGWYLRRVGLLAIGGTSSCDDGLPAGIPDLRKA